MTPNEIEKELKRLNARIQELERESQNQSDEELVKGTTSSSANNRLTWSHGLNRVPTRWYPVRGAVYVHDMDEKTVDVRSTKTSERFEIIIS